MRTLMDIGKNLSYLIELQKIVFIISSMK